ncbi:hypothetical protein [Bartonella tribocorum]|uniref:hypothetical protein n=1 Tax=Bartonella tribocorum TaxID=85701 RepID=UPI00043ACC2A|nr:hypothetical protein [Bartonella tribocorum]CDO49556.1 hypothetical integral membrane protein [Bartonella tribocorum]
MSQGLWFLLLVVFFGLFAVALVFLDKLAARRGVTRWRFWGRWVVFYGLVSVYLGFISVGAGRLAWSQELLLKEAVFSFLFGAVLGLGHWGVTRLPVFWQGFVKASLFCCMMAVFLMLFAVGVRDMDSVRGMFLKVLVFTVLLKGLLGVFIREQSDTLLQRALRVLNFLLFCCILGTVFNFTRWGAEHLGLSWLWFSNEDVLIIISTCFFILTCQGAKSARVMVGRFLKKGVV